MTKLNKANILQNVAIIIGQKEEMNAVRECQKLGIKMFNVVDTNCNPTFADHIIPSNDDSRNSIKYILQKFLTRIRLAQKIRRKLIKLQKSAF
jgi:small subunit ribosomal protein S2